ncbi:MAG: hypothetical protein K0R17_228 [Rariglobus sp.]|jgi:hypothetical protein|nr:hypothetical protein [Rariglobus sp.]
MSLDPHAQLDQTVLDKIEQSPIGAVPHTPTYQDALRRLYATHQVYASADHKDCHVTTRSLAKAPLFYASNLDSFVAGQIDAAALETNASVFSRYVQSLPAALRDKAEALRLKVIGRAIQHRKHHGPGEPPVIHDPVNSIFLVPGTGPHPGLPGNYLYGSLHEIVHPGAPSTWSVQLHDSEDAVSSFNAATMPEALTALQDVIASAPFHLSELAALGFKAN